MAMIEWECPHCKYRTKQPKMVKEISHPCGAGKRPRALKRVVSTS